MYVSGEGIRAMDGKKCWSKGTRWDRRVVLGLVVL